MGRDRPPFKTIGSRFPAEIADAITADAGRLQMSVSDWMRMAASFTLASQVQNAIAATYTTADGQRPVVSNGNGSANFFFAITQATATTLTVTSSAVEFQDSGD